MENDYRNYIEALAQSGNNEFFLNRSEDHVSVILSTIFKHSKNNIRMFIGDFDKKIPMNHYYLDALKTFIISGKKLEVLLTDQISEVNSLYRNIVLSCISSESNNVFIKNIDKKSSLILSQAFDNPHINFTVGDERMYCIENGGQDRKSIGCFNDVLEANKLSKIFDDCFFQEENIEKTSIPLFIDKDFEKKCSIIITDFKEINMELISYFSKNPDALQNLEHRKFEMLLDVIFRNQGYITELGPGIGDGGVDLRLIQKDTVGEIITLVQAKRYKKNPIRLDAVKALTATVDRQGANRGLFVTTSRYLPGVEKWASEQPTKIVLAKSINIAEWCSIITNSKKSLL